MAANEISEDVYEVQKIMGSKYKDKESRIYDVVKKM